MKRKISCIILSVAVVLAGCSLSGNPGVRTNNAEVNAMSNSERAEVFFEKINELYGVKGQNLFLEHYPLQADDKAVSYLWPFSAMFSAVNAIGRLPGKQDKYKKYLDEIMTGLDKYYDDLRTPPAYQAYPYEFGGDDRFYDDNMWLGLDFVEAYKLTGDSVYLNKSKSIFEFIKSGWSEDLGGGIFWCEQKRETKNTCSNGPAALLALKLYFETEDKSYLDWGLKIYDWTKLKLQSPDGVYWDNINLQGGIDKATYAYNSGTMLNTAVLLYQATKKADYLEEARRVAKASFDHFAPVSQDGSRFFPQKDPWFTTILVRGYEDLYKIDGNPVYMEAVIKNIDYAWTYAKDENGLISRDWSGKDKGDRDSKWLLDEACMVELYAAAAIWEEK